MSPSPYRQSRRRVLLALDGGKLTMETQHAALRACIGLSAPLDILVTETPEQTSPMPAFLMLRLEHSGMDYRFAQVNGPLSTEIQRYLSRGRTPSTLIVAEASQLSPTCQEDVRTGRHQLIDLSRPGSEAIKLTNQTAPHSQTQPLLHA